MTPSVKGVLVLFQFIVVNPLESDSMKGTKTRMCVWRMAIFWNDKDDPIYLLLQMLTGLTPLFLFIYLFIFTLCSNICKMLCIIPRVTFDSVWGFFCPFPFDRHWKRCFFLFCFWASLATIVCGGCHRSVSFTVLGETWSELLQLGTQKSCVCLRSLCRPRDSAEQNPNTSQY